MAGNSRSSEYDNAQLCALQIAYATLLELGASKECLLKKLEEAREIYLLMEAKNAAATIALLIRYLGSPPK
jgi:hypothetical protein